MTTRMYWALALVGVLLAVQGVVLFAMGQPLICECGYVKVWEGAVLSAGNSQHLTDWYTFSHVIHGILFYVIVWFLFPKMSLLQRFLIALCVEIGWELIENTPWVIDLYRQQALAQGYTGDSIINSIFDTLAMVLGFVVAWRLPVWLMIAFVVAAELFVGYMIHDNLTLNILNFVLPLEFITNWQSS